MTKIFHFMFGSVVIRMVLLLIFPPLYSYDEIIFISFSKQPFPLLLETLMAEPHPPGFFLLLKLLPVEHILVTRLIMVFISFSIVGIGLLYGYKTKIMQKANLTWGIALFLTSYSFYASTMYVRDKSISFPISFVGIIMMLHVLEKGRKKLTILDSMGLGIVGVLLLLLSYDVFLFFMIALIMFSVCIRKKELFSAVGAITIITGVYMWIYGIRQFAGNTDRSIWFSYVYNSVFHSFYKHIAGVLPFSFITDVSFFIYILLIGIFFSKTAGEQKKPTVVVIGVCILTACWGVVSFGLHLFPRPHYVALLYLLVSIIAGWGMIRIAHKKLQYALFVILAIVGFSAYMLDIQRTRTLYTNLPRIIGDSIEGEKEPYGLLSTAPLMPYVLKIEYFPEEKRLIPLQIMTEKHLGADSITVDHLSADTVFDSGVLTADKISRRLGVFGLQNIMYYSSPFTNTYAVDYSQATLLVLAASCEERGVQKITDTQYLYTFRNCLFSQPISHAGL